LAKAVNDCAKNLSCHHYSMREIAKIEHERIAKALEEIVEKIVARHRDTPNLAVAGIAHGGIAFSRKLTQQLALRLCRNVPLGVVDIAFHRDDIGTRPIPLTSASTDLPFAIDEATVILADDVYFSGRTARAALNEIFDQGRPSRVELAVLCERSGRRLPIVPDYVGFVLETTPEQRVEVRLDFDHPMRDGVRVLGE
jgi:pyrimidine operon attenuation protein/uracil phosphoribosyltransferase